MASSAVPCGSTSSGLTNNQKSNLQITLNMKEGFNYCNVCNEIIDDCLCFCNECRKYLHPACAKVEIQIRHDVDRDGSKYIKLPALEDLPVSCPNCLGKMPTPSSITSSLLSNNNQGSSQNAVGTSSSSITRFLGSRSVPADEHTLFLIHKSVLGHELIEQEVDGDVYTCFGCKEKGIGPHHACRYRSCPIRFHEECKSLRLTTTHPIFPGLSFDFCSKPITIDCETCKMKHSDTSCSACGMYADGYFYRSPDDKHHLHPCCANLPCRINCGDTGATMALQQKTTSECYYCGKIKVKRGDKYTNEVWSYASVGEDCHLHVGCIIEMLSDLKDDSTNNNQSRLLTLHKKVAQNGVTEINLRITARADTAKKWEKRLKTFMKYAKIVLGAIISAFLGEPSTFFTSLIVALIRPDN